MSASNYHYCRTFAQQRLSELRHEAEYYRLHHAPSSHEKPEQSSYKDLANAGWIRQFVMVMRRRAPKRAMRNLQS